MNTIRLFAFIAAVLITAAFFRVIADGLTDEQTVHVAADAGATYRPQPPTKDRVSHPIAGEAPAAP